jgi:ectoine hydroxylase-related dioxygenase (phytanoyl-CoA dioxygenase family)
MNNISEQLLEEFEYSIKTLGFYKFSNCINDKELIRTLSCDVDIAIQNDLKELGDSSSRFYDITHQLLGRSDSFATLAMNSAINDCVERILTSTCIIHSFNAVKLMPSQGNNATKIHRDSPRFYNQEYPLALQAIIFLDPFTHLNGATYMLAASHHSENRPSDNYFYKNAKQMVGNPGDVVFFDSLVWHAGGENITNDPRRGITIVYTRSFMKQQIDLPRAISVDKIARLPEKVRQKIGMDVRVPADLIEFSVPINQRFYKPNQG